MGMNDDWGKCKVYFWIVLILLIAAEFDEERNSEIDVCVVDGGDL